MHENPSALTTLQRDLMKFGSWKTFFFWGGLLLHDFSLAWFVFVIATLEIVLLNHTWNIVISSKAYFVIIKIKINQTLVSQLSLSFFVDLRVIIPSEEIKEKRKKTHTDLMWLSRLPTSMETKKKTFTIFQLMLHKRVFILTLGYWNSKNTLEPYHGEALSPIPPQPIVRP